ncbi:hypothetical protein L3Q82_022031, partial [Scortum barcoo]
VSSCSSIRAFPQPYAVSVAWLDVVDEAYRGKKLRYVKPAEDVEKPDLLRSQNSGLLVVPRVSRSSLGGRAFSYQAPVLWNQLPVWVREADTVSVFKNRLKTFFFDKAYS